MIDKKRVRGLSAFLLEAHHSGVMIAIDPAFTLESLDEAYWVQEVVLRGIDPQRPMSWKISPPRDGAEPTSSPTPCNAVKRSPAEFVGANRVLGVEAEVAFRFAKAPKVKGKNVDIAGAIEEAFVLIELCATRYYNVDELKPIMKLADFQSHAGFALGTGIANWRELDFKTQPVDLQVNGKSTVARKGSHPTGDPFAMVEWAAKHCAARGMPLAAGDVVTTGSWTGMTPVAPGDEVVAKFEGIGSATLRLAS
jgi:hypothetical protein